MKTIFEQADGIGGGRFRYSWIVGQLYFDNIDGRARQKVTGREMERMGWRWVSGRRPTGGAYVTNDPAAVAALLAIVPAVATGPVSNGTHAAGNAPMHAAAR